MQRAGHGLQARPKKSVMHDEEIDPALGRDHESARRRIDRGPDFFHTPGILDLQSVERVRPILDLAQAEVIICVRHQLVSRGHVPICRRKGKFRAILPREFS